MTRSVAPPEPQVPPPERRRFAPLRLLLPLAATALLVALYAQLCGSSDTGAPAANVADAQVPSAAPGPRGELTVEGLVRDDLGAPLERAQLQITLLEWPDLPPRVAVTDSAGRFMVRQLPRELLLVSVTRDGHEGDEQTLRPGDPLTLTFVLARQGELQVLLRDEPGRVLEGAEVVLTGPELWPPRSERANAQGEVLFKGLAGGTYSARARKQDRIAPPSPFLWVVPGDRARQELSLRAGERLVGTVVDGDSKRPLSSVRVSVQDMTPGIAAVEGVTDANGVFQLSGLWPVPVRLQLDHDEYARGFEELKLPHPATLTLTLRGAVSLGGRVVDERGKPVPSAAVSLSTRDERPLNLAPTQPGALSPGVAGVGELGVTTGEVPTIPVSGTADGWGLGALATFTDGDGRFRIDGLPPVPLLVSVSQRGYAGATLEVSELAPHQRRSDLELVLRVAGRIAGRLLDGRGEPVASVPISARSSAGEHATSTDARGEFALNDLLGEVSITASPAGYVATHCRVTVIAGETARCELRIDSPLFTLPVRVVDEYGHALEGAEITARFQLSAGGGEKVQRSVTRLSASDGTATLGELPMAPYKLDVALVGYVSRRDIEVASAQHEVRVSLQRAASLAGIVLDALGRPVPAALVSSDGAESGESSSDGTFTLTGVAPGALTLKAAHPRAGSGNSVELRARPSETLGGIRIVLSGRYEPLADAGSSGVASGDADGNERAAPADTTFAQRGQTVVVARLQPGSPAARAGLRDGDVLQAIDGEPPLSAAHARGLLRDPAGKIANVRVLRQRRALTLRYRRPPL